MARPKKTLDDHLKEIAPVQPTEQELVETVEQPQKHGLTAYKDFLRAKIYELDNMQPSGHIPTVIREKMRTRLCMVYNQLFGGLATLTKDKLNSEFNKQKVN